MFGIKIIKKSDYERMELTCEDYSSVIEDNRQMNETIKKLTKTINEQNTGCRTGTWCEDCKHKKYARTKGWDYEYYCGKHIHEICPEWEPQN